MSQGYYRWPTVHGDMVVFVCEDDLWEVPLKGGVPRRLTAGLGQISFPHYSPDGKQLAFIGSDEGHLEVYVMPAQGGTPQRLSYTGALVNRLVGWTPDGKKMVYSSSDKQRMRRMVELFTIDPEGGLPESLGYGMAHHISWSPKKGAVIGRHTGDIARWKRYKGGTKGDIWIDRDGKDTFTRLLELNGNISTPMWIGDRIYFVADHEGVGNLYSCSITGKSLKRHTDHLEYYVRHPTTDGQTIVYHAGANIHALNLKSGKNQPVKIQWSSPQVQRYRKFVSASQYLERYTLHPEGHSIVLITRGKPFSMGLWEGAARQHGEPDGVRYRFAQYLHDGKRLVVSTDAPGEETLEIHYPDTFKEPDILKNLDMGRPDSITVSPTKAQVAVANHRCELLLVDLDKKTSQIIDKSINHGGIEGVCWAPDGEWLAYGIWNSPNTCIIRLCQVKTGEKWDVTRPILNDFSPVFDPDGKYLYFLSSREFNPVYDEMHFALSFPYGTRPYLVTLQKSTPSPFLPSPDTAEEKPDEDKKKKKSTSKKPEKIKIDVDGLPDRLVAFPVQEGRYRQLAAISGKVMYTLFPVEGSLGQTWTTGPSKPKGTLKIYDLNQKEEDTLIQGMSGVCVSDNAKKMAVRVGDRIRVLPAGEKPSEKQGDSPPGRSSAWLDLKRVKVSVTPALEWKQMYSDAWRRMRDHFWTANMSGVDWKKIYDRYLPLLERIASRSEFSDLMWEMQGELGTSHAYEMGGDYQSPPQYTQGVLGADFSWDARSKGYRITHLIKGDIWDPQGGPLSRPGLNIEIGDVIIAINGRRLSKKLSPDMVLVNCAGTDVMVTLAGKIRNKGRGRRKAKPEPRTIHVKAIASDAPARYRDWVEANREYVHKKTKGRIGYVHIPDMGPWGFAEFHRYYLSECQYDGLLVDLRFNGGGHVSQLLLDKLCRKRIGYDLPRWGQPEPYPSYAILGPIVALTDENAGSDGDIFSHSFKMFKLGPLIGKRTWGGVIGINGRGRLVDGSITTQPEYSFWFHDVGWGVENYGTDPDIEVEYPPHAYKAGKDPQLERSVKEMQILLKEQKPAHPDFTNRPLLHLPQKLPR